MQHTEVTEILKHRVTESQSGARLDQIAAEVFTQFSRARIQRWIRDGALLVNGQQFKPKQRVHAPMNLELHVKPEPEGEWVPEDIDFDVVHEDSQLIVINKAADMVVHPGAGNWEGTLLNALIYRYPELLDVPRAGIVHRLDKDTTGLMVVARTLEAQTELVRQLQDRSVSRCYLAVVHGDVSISGRVDQPIGRHPTQRTRMAVVGNGKTAISHYRPLQRYGDFTLVEVKLETGRTHQIRVHMKHLGYPLVGDSQYHPKARFPKTCPSEITQFPRQALHATELSLVHPQTREQIAWQVDMPLDMQQLCQDLDSFSNA